MNAQRLQVEAQQKFIQTISPDGDMQRVAIMDTDPGNFKAFAKKVMAVQHNNIATLEDCRFEIEKIFEENFLAERDFLDVLLSKLNNKLRPSNQLSFQANKKPKQLQDHNQFLFDDQDQRPMELEAAQNQRRNQQWAAGLEEEEKKGESKAEEEEYVSYFEKCKIVGRIGPKITKLDPKSAHGEAIYQANDQLDIEAKGKFVSIRANTGVFKGRFYYEVLLKTSGLMQIGFSTLQTPFSSQKGVGVGDESTSYAYDGFRVKKWNGENLAYGEAWSVGDVIGVLIDFNVQHIQFFRNEKSLGIAFTNIKTGPNCVYFPAISLERGQRAVFNFGALPMRITKLEGYMFFQEPDAEVQKSTAVCGRIIDSIKEYLIAFWEFPKIPIDERLALGSVLIEYLFPLVLDDYLMLDQFWPFMHQVVMIGKPEFKNLILDLIEMHLSSDQLRVFVQKFMRLSILKCQSMSILVNHMGKPASRRPFDLLNFQLILEMVSREEYMYAWIFHDSFFEDLENLFELHMPSQTDWDHYFDPPFHEYVPGSQDKIRRSTKNYFKTQKAFNFHQKYWLKLTSLLMERKKLCISTTDQKKAPFDRFRDFLHYIACKNTHLSRQNQAENPNQEVPFQAGLNNTCMLTNLFACSMKFMEHVVTKPVSCFPFHCLFMRDGFDFDDSLKRMDRIGGSFTHLENELRNNLQAFKGLKLTEEEKEQFLFAKDMLIIFVNGMLPELEKYTLALDQMYLYHRKLLDLTHKGRIEKSSEICNDMCKIVRTQLSRWRFVF
mmetsp:Transcript_13627/g.23196  ORF Transcript_13627/g.23196 Transcript_13627/m.23196 type:complete len:774 (+) Transcript_13627:464-2785(+)